MDVATAINIAWKIRDGVLRTKPSRPTAEEALQILDEHQPSFNWLTGAECRKALREHLGLPGNDGWK